jgi:hypothetical protein
MSATVADIDRFGELYRLGCVVSRLIDLDRWEPADIHHLVEGQRRLGHQSTIPLSPWFHRGVPSRFDMRPSEATKALGPSLAINKRAFVEQFGTERQLLELTNELLGLIHDSERMAAAIEGWRRRHDLDRPELQRAAYRDGVDTDTDHDWQVRTQDSVSQEERSDLREATDETPIQD